MLKGWMFVSLIRVGFFGIKLFGVLRLRGSIEIGVGVGGNGYGVEVGCG